VTLHVLVPGAWTVKAGHDWLRTASRPISAAAVPHAHVITHLEPMEDPRALSDQSLDRVPE
jgi:hypothetical protein